MSTDNHPAVTAWAAGSGLHHGESPDTVTPAKRPGFESISRRARPPPRPRPSLLANRSVRKKHLIAVPQGTTLPRPPWAAASGSAIYTERARVKPAESPLVITRRAPMGAAALPHSKPCGQGGSRVEIRPPLVGPRWARSPTPATQVSPPPGRSWAQAVWLSHGPPYSGPTRTVVLEAGGGWGGGGSPTPQTQPSPPRGSQRKPSSTMLEPPSLPSWPRARPTETALAPPNEP